MLLKTIMKMKQTAILFFLTLIIFVGCKSNRAVDLTDPLESGRGFIDASLKGDYVRADEYMLQDSVNEDYLNGLKDFSKNLTKIERENYREANIIIDSLIEVSDSVNVLYFANTYKKEQQKLKIIRKDNKWVVDFKYTFLGE